MTKQVVSGARAISREVDRIDQQLRDQPSRPGRTSTTTTGPEDGSTAKLLHLTGMVAIAAALVEMAVADKL